MRDPACHAPRLCEMANPKISVGFSYRYATRVHLFISSPASAAVPGPLFLEASTFLASDSCRSSCVSAPPTSPSSLVFLGSVAPMPPPSRPALGFTKEDTEAFVSYVPEARAWNPRMRRRSSSLCARFFCGIMRAWFGLERLRARIGAL